MDLGCGEGRISRELTDLGWRVTASDIVPTMLEAAQQALSAKNYLLADAADLPVTDNQFDLVVAYNMLMDVEDVPGTVREIARVLKPRGHAIVSLVHPFVDRGRFAGKDVDAPFVVEGSYFGRERFEGSETRNGLTMDFAGWSQPLEAYAEAFTQAGLAITGLREPRPAIAPNLPPDMARWQRLPLFLWLKLVRL
ncbi:class I SAM-dependent methyltransferase [Lacibacterium aquatile]|uniref:Class I SAM-dependent methyltransferase n=1 Tax=Lacibacterium aquatile TaxID=1168082 RepID=A0ABW5DNF1_9PROT